MKLRGARGLRSISCNVSNGRWKEKFSKSVHLTVWIKFNASTFPFIELTERQVRIYIRVAPFFLINDPVVNVF